MQRSPLARIISSSLLSAVLLAQLAIVPVHASTSSAQSASGVMSPAATMTTIAGSDRFATAAAVARSAYPSGSDTVVIANGTTWPDAVGGGVLAGVSGGPILLVNQAGIPAATKAELTRLAPKKVFILGGAESVPETLAVALAQEAVEATAVVRLAGENRYLTAAKVASETIDAVPPSWGGQALVASGRTYADALAAGPFAIVTSRPIYLIDEVHAQTVISAMRKAGVKKVAVLGGDAAVPPTVRGLLADAFGASNVDRVAGKDRYETATLIAELAVRYSGFSFGRPGLATGTGFADSLSAAPLLAQRRSPLLLAPPQAASDRFADWLYAHRAEISGFTAFGGDAALTPRVRQDMLMCLMAPRFDSARAMNHVRAIAGLGQRRAGGTAERQALQYVVAQLRSYGYTVGTQEVGIPGGTSLNVSGDRRGTSPEVIVIGAHADSKAPSPGANDNASGLAVMLELARILAQAPTVPTIRFMAFGAEEVSGSSADDHHFGSRGYVNALSSAQRASIAGMVSVDMVGYGSTFNIRSTGMASKSVVYSLQKRANYTGVALPYLHDFGRYGWSDHEAFERVGIPAAWLEWREDPVYHTTADTASHVDQTRIDATGRLLRGWTLSMSDAQLSMLR